MAILLGTLDSDVIDGTDFLDIVTGLAGDDRIIARGGADVIDGGTGDDRIYAAGTTDWRDGAVDTVLAGAGDDQVYAAYGDILDGGIGLDSLWLDMSTAGAGVTADFRPRGIDLIPIINIGNANVGGFEIIRQVIGSDFADEIRTANANATAARLDGGAGDDLLQTGGGNDRLDGGTGADRMYGGAGDDSYFVDNRFDGVAEAADRGYDRVYSSVDYGLRLNVEALTLTGTAVSGRGNALDNRLEGNDVANKLFGFAGDDRLDGGAGNDRLDGGTGRDTLIGGLGADTFLFGRGSTGVDARTADVIADFSQAQNDCIALRDVDAVVGGQDDRFTFIGGEAFSGTAGELRVQVVGTDTLVFGDTNGDRIADLAIRVQDVTALTAADFVL